MDQLHLAFMQQALDLACRAPAKTTNFRVGALIVNEATQEIVSSGFTNERPGNTHAEQCAISNLQSVSRSLNEAPLALYTTMEPCNKRASGNVPCTDTIIRSRDLEPSINIQTVYVGVHEPETFVGENHGQRKLEEAGIAYVHVLGLEKAILEVATAGHKKSNKP